MRRLESGGHAIMRDAPLRFTFDGREMTGFDGDTLASALLANGVDVVCRSPLQSRPRGVMTDGPEEPSAMVAVLHPWIDVVTAATMVDLVDGLVAEGRPGVGRLPAEGEPAPAPRSDRRYAHVETLVIGCGSVGSEVISDAAEDERVLYLDTALRENQLVRGVPMVPPVRMEGEGFIPEIHAPLASNLRVLHRTTALGIYDDGYVLLHEQADPAAYMFGVEPHERIWHVRAKRVVLATGAHERFIVFADCDRPGVMLAGSAGRYVDRYGVAPGNRAVVFTTNDAAYQAAFTLQDAGVEVAAVADVRPKAEIHASAAARGIEVLPGWAVAAVEGEPRVERVVLTDGRERRTVDADLVAVSGGFNPVVQLARAIGAGLRYDEARACFVPDGTGPPWLEIVGAAAGDGLPESAPFWFTPADDLSRHFIDLQRDQTVADVADAVRMGLRSVEHVKRATYIGTALDQGRTSGVATAEVVNALLGWDAGAQGPTNARPPYTPVSYSALAGRDRGDLLDPIRRTSIHPWHVARGAAFENIGQWKRPWFFAVGAEGMDDAVQREALATRTTAGVLDASTLGKIEVVGPDAGTFLDRMYTNAMSTLAVGSIRYGLMLGLDGMVMDDGVAIRLAEDRYLVTTTTGGAAKVLDHFEEWLQTEWPELRVFCTSVTEQWATIAVAGPLARDIVGALGTDLDLANDAFPFMTWREGTVAGQAARVCRISFTGELSYEINVPAYNGPAVWEAVMAAGEGMGLVPYGTETMHLLRAEKGFVIVGQDTDGTVTPHDLGMSWIVNERKGDFVGKRSLRRPDTVRSDRKQLVGLLPENTDALLPEGAQLVAEDTGRIPMAMLGHVTSSYRSPNLGRTFALAMVERGRERHGERVFAPLPEGTIAATITEPIFFDPKGARRDG